MAAVAAVAATTHLPLLETIICVGRCAVVFVLAVRV